MLGEQPAVQRLKGTYIGHNIFMELPQRAGFFLRTHLEQVRVRDARLGGEIRNTVFLAAQPPPQCGLHSASLQA